MQAFVLQKFTGILCRHVGCLPIFKKNFRQNRPDISPKTCASKPICQGQKISLLAQAEAVTTASRGQCDSRQEPMRQQAGGDAAASIRSRNAMYVCRLPRKFLCLVQIKLLKTFRSVETRPFLFLIIRGHSWTFALFRTKTIKNPFLLLMGYHPFVFSP